MLAAQTQDTTHARLGSQGTHSLRLGYIQRLQSELEKRRSMVKYIHKFGDLLVEMQYRCDQSPIRNSHQSTIAYVTDYITKTSLKTHTMFEVVRTVFNRNSEFLSGDSSRHEKARKLMIQIVNSLTVQAEIGAPMASLYLLGHNDHYTSHTFKSFFWRPYVNEARQAWEPSGDENVEAERLDRVVVEKVGNTLIGLSPVLDYIYRPSANKGICLYDWIRLSNKKKMDKAASLMLHKTSPPMESSDEETLVHNAEDSGIDIDTDAQEYEMDIDDDFFSDDTVCDGKDSDYLPENRNRNSSKGSPISESTPTAFDSHCSAVL